MDNLTHIEDYFQGSLLPEEKSSFEKRLGEDQAFAEEVAFYLSAKKLLLERLREEKKDRFRTLYTQSQKRPAIIYRLNKTWLYAAAAAIVFLAAGIIFFLQPSSGKELAENYIEQNLRTLSVTMGSGEDSLQYALGLYNDGKFLESAQQLERINQDDTTNYTAKTYAGISQLLSNNYERAIEYFTQVQANTSLRSNPGKFYLALTLLKRAQPGDEQAAKRLLQDIVNQNLEGKETAEQWLKKL